MKHLVLISMILLGCGEDDKTSVTKAVAAAQEDLKTKQSADCQIEDLQGSDDLEKQTLKEGCE